MSTRRQVNSFLCSSVNDLKNRLLPINLIAFRNKERIMENMRDITKVLESQGNTHNKVEVQANSESRSLTLSSTRSPGPPCFQIDVQDVSDL
jgi:hypothetical protein